MHPAKRDSWADLQITRAAVIEANTIRSAPRAWKHWCAWCLEQGEDPLQPTRAAPVAFYTAAQKRQARHAPRTVPTTRFNHLRWIATNMGAPVRLDVSDRPARQTTDNGLSPEQRVASDPEVHLHLDRLLPQLSDIDPAMIVIAVIQLLWMSVLRFQHMQRSMPVELTANFLYGVCWKGKGKPGYRWACPRYGPTGADVGSCIWKSCQKLAKIAPNPLFGLLCENTVPFSLANFRTASRAVLREYFGMQPADIFSSFSLRRSMPTLVETSGTHPDDADALGDWISAKNSRMRIRYVGSRSSSSRICCWCAGWHNHRRSCHGMSADVCSAHWTRQK